MKTSVGIAAVLQMSMVFAASLQAQNVTLSVSALGTIRGFRSSRF